MKLHRNTILLIILLIGLFFRFYDLGKESIWIDEGFSITVSKLSLIQIIKEVSQDAHPPLYFIILHYWIKIFGDSEFSTRFLSTIFGVCAIFMMYKVGSLLFNKKTGIISALLLALSKFHIHYSQDVRMYSLIALLTLVSFYFFIKFFNKRNFVILISYILSSILLIYAHSVGIFIILLQNIYVFTLYLLSKKNYKFIINDWILLQIILIILYMPWIGILRNQLLTIQNNFSLEKPTIYLLLKTFTAYAGSPSSSLLFFLILLFLSIVTYKKIRKNFRNSLEIIKNIQSTYLSIINKIYLLLMWLLIPIIFPFIISQFFTPIYIVRITIASSLSFYLLIAKGIEEIQHKFITIIIFSLLIIFAMININQYYFKINNEQWRETVNYIDRNAKSKDLILTQAKICQDVVEYYSKRTDLNKKIFVKIEKYNLNENDIKELELNIKGFNRIWLILSYTYDNVEKILKKTYKLLNYKNYFGIKLYLFKKT